MMFKTELDRSPADDDGSRMTVVWSQRAGAPYAHAYPAALVDGRHHLCQGQALSNLIEPSMRPGVFAQPLFARSRVRAFLVQQYRADTAPVCGSCYGVLWWLFGDQAAHSVAHYRQVQANSQGQL